MDDLSLGKRRVSKSDQVLELQHLQVSVSGLAITSVQAAGFVTWGGKALMYEGTFDSFS